jgi:hypothetical protein
MSMVGILALGWRGCRMVLRVGTGLRHVVMDLFRGICQSSFRPSDSIESSWRIEGITSYRNHGGIPMPVLLLCRCDSLCPDHQMNLFTAGLGEPMCSDVEMQQPSDLQAAMIFGTCI